MLKLFINAYLLYFGFEKQFTMYSSFYQEKLTATGNLNREPTLFFSIEQ